MEETRKQFISRMAWLLSEINASEKGSVLDGMKLLEYHLGVREDFLNSLEVRKMHKHIYDNVDGNKGKLFTRILDDYENKKE